MKLEISLSEGYAGSESDLTSLKNPVPNGDFHYFGMNPISHSPNARRLNEQNERTGIQRRKKVKAKVDLEKKDEPEAIEDGGLGEKPKDDGKHILPDGADMYYGLKPLEHNPITQLVLSSAVASAVKIKEGK